MKVGRVFVLVLDSLGVGALPDADRCGDAGAHTLDHLIQEAGMPSIPRLSELGLGCIQGVRALACPAEPRGAFGRMAEAAPGKDTPTGHWEMMGCVLRQSFPVFPDGFPPDLIQALISRARLSGVLCNRPASGTEVIERYGPEHLLSLKPIIYTSADSVLQIAAHQDFFGLERLYEVCEIARELTRPLGLGRVIARPFVGTAGAFRRTYDRRDWSLEPPHETVLDRLKASGQEVVGIGKISDIFAGRGLTRSLHSEGNHDGMRLTYEVARTLPAGLVFLNLVDFDSLYGHRRDAVGYAKALADFDVDLRELERWLRSDDLVLMSADHGNDPSFHHNSDHTREYVPLLALGNCVRPGVDLGTRSTFADLGATVEEALGLAARGPGRSFWQAIQR